jgi:hypothetical protein
MKKVFVKAAKLMFRPTKYQGGYVDGACIAIEAACEPLSGSKESSVFAGIFRKDASAVYGRMMYWMGDPSTGGIDEFDPTRQLRTWALLLASVAYRDVVGD